MTNRDLSLRLATAEDIGVIAHVVNTVSEGVVEALLGGTAARESRRRYFGPGVRPALGDLRARKRDAR